MAAVAILSAVSASAQQTMLVPEPNEMPACSGQQVVPFAQVEGAVENLAFDGNGSLFVTAFGRGLYQVWPNGTVRHVVADTRPAPPNVPVSEQNAFMGIDVGPDGALYVAEGQSIGSPVAARILRFPVPGEPGFEVVADGFDGLNGLAVTPDGTIYAAHGFRNEVYRIRNGTSDVWAEILTANGLVEHPDGKRLVVAQVADPSTHIVAISIDDPSQRETLAKFNGWPALDNPAGFNAMGPLNPKGVDDLVLLDDGMVVAAAHLRMQFLAANTGSGRCILVDGTRGEPTSARVAVGFGEWDGWVFGTDQAGDITAINVTAMREPGVVMVLPPVEEPGETETGEKESPGPAFATLIALVLLVALRRRVA